MAKKYKGINEQIIVQEFVQNKLGIAKNLSMNWFTYAGYANSGKSRDAQPLNLTAEKYTGGNYGQHYSKTAVFMRYLQHYLGEDKMDEILQEFYRQWEFRHPYPEDLEAVFSAHLQEDLDWFFDNVFEKTTYVDYGIKKKPMIVLFCIIMGHSPVQLKLLFITALVKRFNGIGIIK